MPLAEADAAVKASLAAIAGALGSDGTCAERDRLARTGVPVARGVWFRSDKTRRDAVNPGRG